MFRKSVVASALSLALLPNAAEALGLGGIRTQSALNEPFSGQIELLDIKPDELDTVKVSLASKAEFDKVGTARPHFLTGLEFQPRASSRGSAFIQVTSNQPVREPFLDFLIEVNWPTGRLVREYTVLLDPPVTLNRRAPGVTRARIQRPPPSVDTSAFPMRYGPVEPGSGLWRIARSLAPIAGATVAQTAMALYRSNQQAFIRSDINKLKVDEILEIPTATELFALDARAADLEFRAALQGGSVTRTPLTDLVAETQSEDRLEIASAAESRAQTSAERPSASIPPQSTAAREPPTRVAAEDGPLQAPSAQIPTGIQEAPTTVAEGSEIGTLQEDLLLIQEAGESTRQETEELRSRIRELEGQLADIQRLLELSNERFAALQQAGSVQLDTAGAEATDTPPSKIGKPLESAIAASRETEAIPTSDEPPAQTLSQPRPEDTTRAALAETASEPTSLLGESIPPSLQTLALALVLLLLFLGWMIYRRRQSLEESLVPSELTLETPAATDAAAGATQADETPASPSATATSQTFSPYSGFENLDDETEEGDVISEADVYIAYGRYREAESLLEKETEKSPERLDVKYKLAEAYYGAGNVQRMQTLMEQMRTNGEDRIDPDQWQRLNTMLEDLKGTDADRPGQIEAVGSNEMPATSGTGATAQRRPLSAVPIRPGLMPAEDLQSGTQTDGLAGTSDATEAKQPQLDSQDVLSQDLELDIADLDILSGELAASESGESTDVSGAASDLELQLEDLESLKDVDLGGYSSQAPPLEAMSVDVPPASPADPEVDSFDISPLSVDTLDSDAASSQWQNDSGTWDEVATKVDLARAYLEMEDAEAARVILEEVVQEGNENQRAEAREMMAQLS